MGLIFYFSSQPAEQSNSLSTSVTEKMIEAVEKVVPKDRIDFSNWNHIIRKNAHFFIYLVFGAILVHAIRFLLIPKWKTFVYAFGFSVLYAISDEWHQWYVPGRGAQVTDVLIDSTGALTGILLYFVVWQLASKRKKTTSKSNHVHEYH